jgi:proteasome lid subunit RPN8/RPN11
MLYLSRNQLKQLFIHATQTYPEECCGLLIGRLERQPNGEIRRLVEVRQTENAWDESAAASIAAITPNFQLKPTKNHFYWIDPKEMLNAQRDARQQHLDIIGIYHSHPDHPAVPSESDRSLAWAHYSYVIVSVQQGAAVDVKCWSLDENHQFQAEEIRIVE